MSLLLIFGAPATVPNQQIARQIRRLVHMAGDSQHGTLTISTKKTVTINGHFSKITVINRNGAGEIWFTVDGTDPVIGAEGTYLCPAAIWAETVDGLGGDPGSNTVVKLLSSAACTYSVLGG
jgi:hypothetical protein